MFGGLPGCFQQERIIVRCSVYWVSSKRIIVRFSVLIGVLRFEHLNNCSLYAQLPSWDFEHLELLFVPDRPATDWVSDSDFTIVR